MTYREGASVELRFTDRQLEWIHATSTEETVRANLRGVKSGKGPARSPDEITSVLFWLGITFVGLGVVIAGFSRSPLALLIVGPGFLMLAAALARRSRGLPFAISVVTVKPRFEERVVVDVHDNETTLRYLVAEGDDMVWPRKLHALSDQLSETEQLRVGIVTNGGLRCVGWAFPV